MSTIYKVKTDPVANDAGIEEVHVAWASSEGGAKKARRELAEQHGLKPLKEVDYEAVDIPTSKAGIIEWLNENHAIEPAPAG